MIEWARQCFSFSFNRSGNEVSFRIGWFWIVLTCLFWAKVFGWI